MSGVLLRCSNCGTAQAEPGECETCGEGEVRYFCTNHTPGVWLDGAECLRCGARFGDPAPSVREPVSEPSVAERSPVRPRRMDPDDLPWGGPAPRSDGFDERASVPDPTRILLEMLSAAARTRRPSEDYEPVMPRRRGGGCLRMLFVVVLLIMGLFVFGPLLLSMLLGFN